jgi:hypothetical protein
MTDVASGQQATDDITMTKAEHDKLTARVRLAEKTEKDGKAKTAKAKADAENADLAKRLKAAEDAGIGKELRETETERDGLKARLSKVLTDNAIKDAAGSRKWSVSAQRAAAKMLDPSALERDDEGVPTVDSVKTALDGLEGEYPDIYVSTGLPGDGDKGGKKKAVQTPANPGATVEHGAKFQGFISEQEYVDTPFEVRNTQEFRERLDKSRQYWPGEFNHREL